jgi:hypothetical protein
VLLSTESNACDICGCAASSFSLGIMPGSQSHFVGLRSSFRSFKTTHPPLFGINEPGSNEFFTSTDLLFKIRLHKRFQVLGIVPFVYNQQIPDDTRMAFNVNGLGDISLLGNFVFINTTDSIAVKVKQAGTIGLGVKSPTGKHDNSVIQNRNMLPGSGSLDFLASFNYSVQKGAWGFFNETSFSYKGENDENFQFGHAFSTSNIAFYRWAITENMRLIPQVGLQFSHNERDKINGIITDLSFNGGNLLNVQTGFVFMHKNLAINPTVWLPVYQDLSEGYVDQKLNVRLTINYFIKSNRK